MNRRSEEVVVGVHTQPVVATTSLGIITGTRRVTSKRGAIVGNSIVLEGVSTAADTSSPDTEVPVRTARSIGTELLTALLSQVGNAGLSRAVKQSYSSAAEGVLVTTRVITIGSINGQARVGDRRRWLGSRWNSRLSS